MCSIQSYLIKLEYGKCHPKELMLSILQDLPLGNDRKKVHGVLWIFSSFFCLPFRITGLLITPESRHLSSENEQQQFYWIFSGASLSFEYECSDWDACSVFHWFSTLLLLSAPFQLCAWSKQHDFQCVSELFISNSHIIILLQKEMAVVA